MRRISLAQSITEGAGVCRRLQLSCPPLDAQTRKNHSYYPGRRKFASVAISKGAGSFWEKNSAGDGRRELFFLGSKPRGVGLGRGAHLARRPQTGASRNESPMARGPAQLV